MVSLKIAIILYAYFSTSFSLPLDEALFLKSVKSARSSRQSNFDNNSPPYIYASPPPSNVLQLNEDRPSNGYLPPFVSTATPNITNTLATSGNQSLSMTGNDADKAPALASSEQTATTLQPFVSQSTHNVSMQSPTKNETELSQSNLNISINTNNASLEIAGVPSVPTVTVNLPTNAYLPPNSEKPDKVQVEESSGAASIPPLNISLQITGKPIELPETVALASTTLANTSSLIQQSMLDFKPALNTSDHIMGSSILINSTDKPKELLGSAVLTNTSVISTLTSDIIGSTTVMISLPGQPTNSEKPMKSEVEPNSVAVSIPSVTTILENLSNTVFMSTTEKPKELVGSTVPNLSDVSTSTQHLSDAMMNTTLRPSNAYLPPYSEKPNKLEIQQSNETETIKKPDTSLQNTDGGFKEITTEKPQSLPGSTPAPNAETVMIVEMKPTIDYMPSNSSMLENILTMQSQNVTVSETSSNSVQMTSYVPNTDEVLALTPTGANINLSPSSMLMEEILIMDSDKTESASPSSTSMTLSPSNTIMLVESISNPELSNPNYMYPLPSLVMVEKVPIEDPKSESTSNEITNNGHIYDEDGYHYRTGTGFEYPIFNRNYF